MLTRLAWVINASMLAGSGILLYEGAQALGTPAADDALLYFIVGTALGVTGLGGVIGLAGFGPRARLTRGEQLELKQVAGVGTAHEPIEPERTSIWLLSPVSVLLLAGGLATLAALWSSPPPGSGQEPWLVAVAMRAAFGIALTLGGANLGLAVVRHRRDALENARRRAEHPDAPWRWRSDWASGRIRQERGAWLAVGWPLAFVVLGFALQVALTLVARDITFDLQRIGGLALLGGVPLGLFAALTVATARRLKYGRSELVLDSVPVTVGGTLKGRIEAPIRNYPRAAAGHAFSVTLSSIRIRTAGGSTRNKTQSIDTTVLWNEEQKVPAAAVAFVGNGIVVPIAFSLPSGSAMTNKFDARNQVVWQLEIRGARPGLDYHEWFEVPVFGRQNLR